MSEGTYHYATRRRVRLTPTTPGLAPPAPFVVGSVSPGDVVEQGFAFITKPWNGKTPTASLYPMGTHAQQLPALAPLAQVALGAELGTDVYGDGAWVLDRGVGRAYLAGMAENLAVVIDDGRGAAPGSTAGELILFISIYRLGTGAPPSG